MHGNVQIPSASSSAAAAAATRAATVTTTAAPAPPKRIYEFNSFGVGDFDPRPISKIRKLTPREMPQPRVDSLHTRSDTSPTQTNQHHDTPSPSLQPSANKSPSNQDSGQDSDQANNLHINTETTSLSTPETSSVESPLSTPIIDKFQHNHKLQHRYRTCILRKGARHFLRKVLPPTVSSSDLVELILTLGYPKEVVMDYPLLSTREIGQILMELITQDAEFGAAARTRVHTVKYTLTDFISDLRSRSRIMVITGAGISTSLGLPDFRSDRGLYSRLAKLELSDPQKVFDLETFKLDPTIFYSVAHMVLPPEDKLSVLHKFLKLLSDKNKLQRIYTQNVDNLEKIAGIPSDQVVQCHGSFVKATCLTCDEVIDGSEIFRHIMRQSVPRCFTCWANVDEATVDYGVIKPNITFFGEDLPKRFFDLCFSDCRTCDLAIVIGTSLKVEPVASLIDQIPRGVKRVLINREPLDDRGFDLSLIGYCDDVASYLVQRLGEEDWRLNHKDVCRYDRFNVVSRDSATLEITKEKNV
ncbi:uncharacterized protein LODBEIA_P44720 [Lodderomyces beijingensis]|uniref:Deacetylase sirtuin-type domain-containing protein n=1 Tax=Lodderomyces beijingensis TaxID=1775926 RepID=A0ABP0ZRD5_9ASCO